jgi:hypothetical protein
MFLIPNQSIRAVESTEHHLLLFLRD